MSETANTANTANAPAYFNEAWFKSLKNEIAASNMTIVSAKIGVSRPTLSLFVHGKGLYGNGKAAPKNMEIRYRQAYEKLVCPHTNTEVGIEHCRATALCDAPNHNPLKMVQWQSCQQCPYKPNPLHKCADSKEAVLVNPQQAGIIDKVTLPLPVVGAPQISADDVYQTRLQNVQVVIPQQNKEEV